MRGDGKPGEQKKMETLPFERIGVLMGGISREREVSLRSGKAVLEALLAAGLNAEGIDLADGDFEGALRGREIDFAFIALHGAGGEDGTIQAVLEKLGVPYLGTRPASSRKAFDKIESKKVFEKTRVPTPAFEILTSADWRERLEKLRFPVFIKPPCEGSSIDVCQVRDLSDAERGFTLLFEKYPVLMAEAKITGPELTVSILGERPLPVIEIRPKRDFYDYTAKYTKGMTEYLVPAPITSEETRNVQRAALFAHRALGLRDFSRVDVILSGGIPFVLEVNTIPGFTETSLFPKAAGAVGMGFGDLCVELLRIAARRLKNETAQEKDALHFS